MVQCRTGNVIAVVTKRKAPRCNGVRACSGVTWNQVSAAGVQFRSGVVVEQSSSRRRLLRVSLVPDEHPTRNIQSISSRRRPLKCGIEHMWYPTVNVLRSTYR